MIRLMDIILSLLFIVLTLPLFMLIVLLLFVTHGYKIFYSMKRVGRYGKPYIHIKFRSMKKGTETGRVFFEQQRITKIGRILRATHIDELPELWLILFGKESFTGPRPLPQKLLKGLEQSLRQTVRPGWTGPAQIYLMRKGQLNKHLQIKLDNFYVNNRTFQFHCRLILATAVALFSKKTKKKL